MKRSCPSLVATVVIVLTVAALQTASSPASAASASLQRCRSAVHDPDVRARVYAAPDWSVRCVRRIDEPGFAGAAGLTLAGSRQILVVSTTPHPLLIVAHELGHAFSWDRMSARQREHFARLVGEPTFYGGAVWSTMPAEIWANSQARCAGYANTAWTRRVSCRTIRSFVRNAHGS